MSYRRSAIKRVQTGSITLTGVTSNTATLGTAVDKNYSTIELTAQATNSASGAANINAGRVELTNGTTVTGFVNTVSGDTKVLYFTVTEWFPFVMIQPVQHLSFSGVSQAITAVGTKAVLFFGGFTSSDTGGTASAMMTGAELTSTTLVTMRGSGGTVAGCVADFK